MSRPVADRPLSVAGHIQRTWNGRAKRFRDLVRGSGRGWCRDLWVPATLSTLCDLLIFVENAAEPVVSLDLVDLGWRAVGEWS